MSDISIEEAFWTFSVSTYTRNGVSDACLRLQDRHGVDVNILLNVCWVAAHYAETAGEAYLEKALSATGAWTENVVHPLRAARRYLKTLYDSEDEFASFAREHRKQILERELEAERAEQHVLARLAADNFGAGSESGDREKRRFAESAIETYLNHLETRLDDADRRAIKTIVDAAFPARS